MAYEIANKIKTGRKAIASAGVAEKITPNVIQCFMVILSADIGNTNPVVVGDSNVVAASGSQRGVVLVPGNPPVTFLTTDASKIYVDAQTDGDAVCFAIFQT